MKSEIQDDREDPAGVAQGRRKEIRRKREMDGEHGDKGEEGITGMLLERQCQENRGKIEDKAQKKALVLWLDYSISPGYQGNKEGRTVFRLTRNL